MMDTLTASKTNIHALRQKEVILKGKAHLILDAAEREHRNLTDQESKDYGELRTNICRNAAALETAEKNLERERDDAGNRGVQVDSGYDGAGIRRAANAFQRPNGSVKGGRRFSEMFGGNASNDGWSSMSEFLNVVRTGTHDPRLRMSASMNESVPSQGGFLTPDSLSAEILDACLEQEVVRPRAHVTPMVTETKKIAGFEASDSSSGALYGGISATWTNELAAGTVQQPKTRLITLTASKLLLLIPFSSELSADAADFEPLLTQAIIKAASWHLDAAFLGGDGAGKPQGVLNNPALIAIAKESGQATATINYQNVAKMFGSLHPSLVNGACWVVNPTTLPQLLQMTLNVKNVAGTENVGGSATPIFSTDGGQFKMLTLPVLLSEKLPALGSQGDILLANFSEYEIGIRKELSIERSIQAGFTSDMVYFRATIRCDGQSRWRAAYKPRNGSATSWSVTLAARP